ncbi:MAG: hypothetical protein OXI87_22080 [Albidovulum sp.]|nr:hypothetical protein [Albidovulum sp.]
MTFLVNLGIPKYISAIFVAIFIFSCFCALYLIRLWIVEMLPSGKFLAMVPEIKKIIEEIERFFENGKEFDAILNADIDNLYYKFEQLKIPVKNIGNELTAYIFFLNVLSFAEGGRIKDARKLDMAKMIDEDENEKLKDIYKHVKNLRQKSKQK